MFKTKSGIIFSTIKLALKLFLFYFVASLFTDLALAFIASGKLPPAFGVFGGIMFALFILGLMWDTVTKQGKKDSQMSNTVNRTLENGGVPLSRELAGQYRWWKGYVAGILLMLVPIYLTVKNNLMWITGSAFNSPAIYFQENIILQLIFLPYIPLFRTFSTVNFSEITLGGVLPQLPFSQQLLLESPTIPLLYFIPIILTIFVCGYFYTLAHENYINAKQSVKKES